MDEQEEYRAFQLYSGSEYVGSVVAQNKGQVDCVLAANGITCDDVYTVETDEEHHPYLQRVE